MNTRRAKPRSDRRKTARACCSTVACGDDANPSLAERPLLPNANANDLAGLFKVLASETRLRLLHALVRAGELCVTDLAQAVGMSPQALSNQVQRLADRRILASRRDGTMIYYRIVNACVTALLDRGLCLLEES